MIKKNVLVFARNLTGYVSGDYHMDWLDAFAEKFRCVFYGPGFPHYSPEYNLSEVLELLLPFKPDLILVATSWDNDQSDDSVDPNPRIDFSETEIPKVYFLNKEYKKLELRIAYAERNRFELVFTTYPWYSEWENHSSSVYQHLEFGVNLSRFSGVRRDQKRNFDFFFSGGLHRQYTDERFQFKKSLFLGRHLHLASNLTSLRRPSRRILIPEVSRLRVYWAEWGAKDLVGRSLVPVGQAYVEILRNSSCGLNTLSANQTINTRFYEQMAAGNLVIAPGPEEKYRGLLENMGNALIYPEDRPEHAIELLLMACQNRKLSDVLRGNARETVKSHSYGKRVEFVEKLLEKKNLL